MLGGEVGLVLTAVIEMTGAIMHGMVESAELENLMVAVERVLDYRDLPSEAPFETKEESRPHNWPARGEVEFQEVYLKYAEEDKYVLKGLSFKTNAQEKVGYINLLVCISKIS